MGPTIDFSTAPNGSTMRYRLCLLILASLVVPGVAHAQKTTTSAEASSPAPADDSAAVTASSNSNTSPPGTPGRPQYPNLTGTWAQKVVTTALSDVPVLGEVVTRTISLQKVDIAQSGRNLTMTTTVCDIHMSSSVDVVETHIPDRFVAAVGPSTRPANLVAHHGDFYLKAPRKVQMLGVQLRAPDSEHLPDDPADPRVVDPDHDGHPGVTVRVSGLIDGSLYVIHRGWDQMTGKLTGNNAIGGRVVWDLDQVVLASTSIFLGDSPESHAHPDGSQSYFRMIRVPRGADCSKIAPRASGL